MKTVKTVGFQRMATHNGPGIRTTLFVKGCPLHCIWCHNPESQSPDCQIALIEDKCVMCRKCENICPYNANVFGEGHHTINRDICKGCGLCSKACPSDALILYGKEMNVDEVMEEFLKDKPYYESSGGGITVSGGEPTMYIDFVLELLKRCKAEGLSSAIDTCGYAPTERFERLVPLTDFFLFDIKHINPEEHKKYTGVSNSLILQNLQFLNKCNSSVEIRIPCIPKINTDDTVIDAIGELLSPMENVIGVRILPYNNYCGSKYRSLGMKNTIPNVDPPTDSEMQHIKSILERHNLKVIL